MLISTSFRSTGQCSQENVFQTPSKNQYGNRRRSVKPEPTVGESRRTTWIWSQCSAACRRVEFAEAHNSWYQTSFARCVATRIYDVYIYVFRAGYGRNAVWRAEELNLLTHIVYIYAYIYAYRIYICVYIYIYMCIYIHIYVFIHKYLYIYIYIYTYIHIYTYTYICIYMYIADVHIHIYIYIYICMYTYTHILIYIYTYWCRTS